MRDQVTYAIVGGGIAVTGRSRGGRTSEESAAYREQIAKAN